jgi:hypothetical protein
MSEKLFLRKLGEAHARGIGLRLNNAEVVAAKTEVRQILEALRHAHYRNHPISGGCDACLNAIHWIGIADTTSAFQ